MNETKKIQWDCEECGVPLPYPDCPDCGTVQKEIVTACNRDHLFEDMKKELQFALLRLNAFNEGHKPPIGGNLQEQVTRLNNLLTRIEKEG